MYSILDYGASPGQSCTAAIQAALDACGQAGGGQVYVPSGIWLTGTVHLRSHCTLYLENGATLQGSPSLKDYGAIERGAYWRGENAGYFVGGVYALVLAEGVESAGIAGPGVLDGQGTGGFFPNPGDAACMRPFGVVYVRCTDMFLRDVTIKNPPAYAFYAIECTGVMVCGVQVRSWGCGNGDGLDFEGSRDVIISNCILETGDDSISLKTLDPTHPCENYTITNCIFRSMWAGVRLGTESSADMRNIAISNCVFEDCNDGFKIQTNSGGVYEDISLANCVMRGVRRPVLMTQNHFRLSRLDRSVRPMGSKIRRLRIDGLTAVLPAETPDAIEYNKPLVALCGLPHNCLEDITLSNIYLTFPGGGTPGDATRVSVPELLDYTEYYMEAPHFQGRLPAACLYLRHIERLSISGCRLRVEKPDARPAVFACDVHDSVFTDLHASGEMPALLRAGLCDGLVLRGCALNGEPADALGREPELEQSLEAQLVASTRLMADMARWAAVTDDAEAAGLVYIIEPGMWQVTGEPEENGTWTAKVTLPRGRAWLYFPSLRGALAVFVNEKPAGTLCLPAENLYKFVWAVDLSPFATGEAVTLKLVWQTPSPQAGAFPRPFSFDGETAVNCLFAPAQIRAKVSATD